MDTYHDIPMDDIYDMADRVDAALETKPYTVWWNRSAIGRKVKTRDGDEYQLMLSTLEWMDEHRLIRADGNGAWRNYARRERSIKGIDY